jgi:hypothetical protein
MVNIVQLFIVIVIWLLVWHVIYIRLVGYYRPLLFVVVGIHLILIWLIISLLFYWVYMRSGFLYTVLCLSVLAQSWYLIARIARTQKSG